MEKKEMIERVSHWEELIAMRCMRWLVKVNMNYEISVKTFGQKNQMRIKKCCAKEKCQKDGENWNAECQSKAHFVSADADLKSSKL